jgi:hypothetical protein
MGDRANISVKQYRDSEERVYLYTHWGGTSIADALQAALNKRWRWRDPAYLTRIIFDSLTENDHGSETGYGISVRPPDNEHAILDVDCDAQTVTARGALIDHRAGTPGAAQAAWTFVEFCDLPDAQAALDAVEDRE